MRQAPTCRKKKLKQELIMTTATKSISQVGRISKNKLFIKCLSHQTEQINQETKAIQLENAVIELIYRAEQKLGLPFEVVKNKFLDAVYCVEDEKINAYGSQL